MSALLKKYPDTPLRDMAIFWLARANYKAGHRQEAARYMAQFFKEYPDSPLKSTVEDELVTLAAKYAKGEPIPAEEKFAVEKAVAEKAAAEKLAMEKAEAEKIAAAKKAGELRIAAEKAAAEKALQAKLAAEKAAAEKAVAEKAAAEKLAQEKAEAERKAAAKKAEEMRIAAEKAAAEKALQAKLAAEKAAVEKAAAEKAAAEKLAQEKAEAEKKAAAQKAEEVRIAAEKAAAEMALQAKLAEKAAAEKAAAEKAAAEKLAQEKAEAEKKAAAKKAEEMRIAAEKAAAEKALQAKLAAEKAAVEKAAAERAAAEKLAQEKAEAERKAAVKKAEEMLIAAEKAAAEKALQAKLAAEKAAVEKAAAEKAAAEKLAQEKAEAEKKAAAMKAEEMRIAAEKASAEKRAVEKTAAAKADSAPDKRKAGPKKKEKTGKSAKAATLREKAIAEYRSVIDRFPGTAAAASASAKLRQLGVLHPAVSGAGVAIAAGENAKILTLEVGQFADFDFTIAPPAQSLEAGKRFAIPFEMVNLGNGPDSFYLESGFPVEYNLQFAAAVKPEMPINLTPQLAAGEKFKAVMAITVPRSVIDGQKASYPIKLGSQFSRDVSQSREVSLFFSAPLLRAVIKAEKSQLLPGEKVSYRLDLLNIGTSSARGVTLRLNYPPQYEPVNFIPAGFKQEMKAALVLDGLQLNSGESKEFTVTFQLKDEALAQQELFLRADVINNELEKKDSFLSPATFVQGVSGIAVRTTAEKLVVVPGQTVMIPIIVTNTGNQREDFAIKPVIPANASYSFYQDLNRDGKKQENEPMINHVGPLGPKEEAYVVLEVKTPLAEADGTNVPLAVAFEPEGDKARSTALNVRLVYSRPVLDLVMIGKGGKLKPGEVSSFELNCTNRGSNIAKLVDVQSFLPDQLTLVSADPAFTRGSDGVYTWRFDELGAGEKRNIKVNYKVKSGTAVGTNMQVKNILKYQDPLGNSY